MAPRHAASVSASNDQPLPFQIRGASFSLLALKVVDPADPAFFDRLADTLSLAPGFYRNAPIVLDFSALAPESPVDLRAFCQALRDLTLAPVGLQGPAAGWEDAARSAGLAIFPAGRVSERTADPGAGRSARTASRSQRGAAAVRQTPSRLVTDPVRSGQQVYAAGGDLIVTVPVSRGAELLADGNIHVYGPLRGRALAGMSGDSGARIFCRYLDADLVSICGFYMVSEQMDPGFIGKAVQISLAGERLVFELL
ncbi:MAG: septum site-determining protein MinC [Telmatospirillum sp.]|nr:septum site-determining protein MinC [Telmatospirillum sp.]